MIETPMMQYPCDFDVSPRGELMAATHSKEEIAKELGVESVEFNEPDAFAESLISAQLEERRKKNPIKKKNICMGCFTGEYPKYK